MNLCESHCTLNRMNEKEPMDPKDALRRAAALCSRQEQCSGDIRRKLEYWDVDPGEHDQILEKLRKESFLDDERYARMFARDKFRFNRWGKVKIGHALRQKGISTSAAEAALMQIGPDEYLEACLELAGQKARSVKDPDPFIRRGKLFRFLSGRGFEPEIIGKALNRLEMPEKM